MKLLLGVALGSVVSLTVAVYATYKGIDRAIDGAFTSR
jgi:hypothetical protein